MILNTRFIESFITTKLHNDKGFMKLNSNGMVLKLQKHFANDFTIIHSKNQFFFLEFHNADITEESSRDEFEKEYGHIQYLLTKTNCEQ